MVGKGEERLLSIYNTKGKTLANVCEGRCYGSIIWMHRVKKSSYNQFSYKFIRHVVISYKVHNWVLAWVKFIFTKAYLQFSTAKTPNPPNQWRLKPHKADSSDYRLASRTLNLVQIKLL